MSVSLDGFVDTLSHSLDWMHVDEELHALFNDEARAMSSFLYGRRLYEVMTAYWPTGVDDPNATPVEVEFARIWKDKPKVVFDRARPPAGPVHSRRWSGSAQRRQASPSRSSAR